MYFYFDNVWYNVCIKTKEEDVKLKKTAVLWVIIVILLLSNAFFVYEYFKKDNSVPNYPNSESSGENKKNDKEKTSGDIFSHVVKK